MNITIISVGKKPRGAELELIEEFSKRIQAPWNVTWKFLPHQEGDQISAKRTESQGILQLIDDETTLLLLDERGVAVDNSQLAQILDKASLKKEVSLVIGGAFGVDDTVRARANKVIKLSDLVLPHKLVRIVVAEQLYRSQAILSGHPYHHG